MTARSGHNKQSIGIWTCIALVMGNMVGSGIFLLPAALASYGSISLVGWLFTSGGALVLAPDVSPGLSRAMPANGGPYAYSRAGLGDFAGVLGRLGVTGSPCSAVTPRIAVANGRLPGPFLSRGWMPMVRPERSPALAAIWILTLVNASGIRSAGHVQILTTVLKLLHIARHHPRRVVLSRTWSFRGRECERGINRVCHQRNRNVDAVGLSGPRIRPPFPPKT